MGIKDEFKGLGFDLIRGFRIGIGLPTKLDITNLGLSCPTPGKKIRSKGKGKGLGRGRGFGPIGIPGKSKGR